VPWTTDDLVAAVRRTGWFPDADDMSAADLLAWGNAELRADILSLYKSAREEYGITYVDVPVVVGTTRYRLPRRATARTVRDVFWVASDGVETPGEEIARRDKQAHSATTECAFYFEGDHLVMPATPTTASGSWRIGYLEKPSRLVPVADCAPITGSSSTVLVTCSSTPSAVTTATQYVDIVRGESPFPLLYTDRKVASSVANTSITLDAATPIVQADLVDGTVSGERTDYLCARDTTCYPPIPEELHDLLAVAICARGLEARGDPKAAEKRALVNARIKAATAIVNPRHQERSRPMVNHASALRRGRGPRWVRTA
jgi:hypothetical protein